MKKSKIILSTACLVLGIGLGVFADNINETIQAIKRQDINIKFNNSIQSMYDANGVRVYPLSYNDTTYVPIRAVSNIFGVAVNWDEATQTVLLGENSDWDYLEKSNVDKGDKSKWHQDNLNYTYNGVKYNTGIKVEDTGETLFGNNPYDFTLGLKYKQLSCKVITQSEVTVPCRIVITDKDTKVNLYEKLTETNKAEDILIDVTGCDNIDIYIYYNNFFDEMPGKNTIYVVDMKAK